MTIRMFGALVALSTAAAAQFVFEPRADTALPEAFLPGVALGDVDGDGDGDALVGVNPLVVLLNDGGGAFLATPTTIVDASDHLRLADLDGDGALDLVRAVDARVEAALGHGDGTFDAPVALPLPASQFIHDLFVGDVTGDGVPDVIKASGSITSGQMDVRLGVGDGAGGLSGSVVVQGVDGNLSPSSFDVGDLDGDAFPDVALVVNSVLSSSIRLLRSNGAASFTTIGTIGLGPDNRANDLRVDDVTGDGIDDLVVVGNFGLVTFRGLGGGDFAPFALQSTADASSDVVIADLDADGVVDLSYVRDTDEFIALRGLGGGAFVAGSSLTGAGPCHDALTADLDGDGRTDVAAFASTGSGTGVLAVLRNRTYGADEPWADLGQGLASDELSAALAQPVMIASGSLIGGSPVTFEVFRNGAPQDVTFLVVGLSQLGVPFKGGTLVPAPDLLVNLPGLPSSGALELTATFPPGVPADVELSFQTWLAPGGALTSYAASSGVVGVTP